MQYNLEEFETIKDHILEMDIQSGRGFVCPDYNTILLFDIYLIIEIKHSNSKFYVSISDNNQNNIRRYVVYDLYNYKPEINEARKLIDKRFNQIISIWEKFKLDEYNRIKQELYDTLIK